YRAARDALFGGSRRRTCPGQNIFNHTIELVAVLYLFHQRLRDGAVAYHPEGWRVLYADALAQGKVSLYFVCQLAVRIANRRYGNFAFRAEFLHPLPEVVAGDLPLIGKDEAAKLVADLLRAGVLAVKVARPDCRFKRPVVPGQREVMQHHG